MNEASKKFGYQMTAIGRLERMGFSTLPRLTSAIVGAVLIGIVFGLAVGTPTGSLFLGEAPPKFGLVEILTITLSLAAIFDLLLLVTLYGALENLPTPLRYLDRETLRRCGGGSIIVGVFLLLPGVAILWLGNPGPGMVVLKVVATIVVVEGLANFMLAKRYFHVSRPRRSTSREH